MVQLFRPVDPHTWAEFTRISFCRVHGLGWPWKPRELTKWALASGAGATTIMRA